MDFTPALQHATLIQRYKRFLATWLRRKAKLSPFIAQIPAQ